MAQPGARRVPCHAGFVGVLRGGREDHLPEGCLSRGPSARCGVSDMTFCWNLREVPTWVLFTSFNSCALKLLIMFFAMLQLLGVYKL